MLTDSEREAIAAEVSHYPDPRAACLDALRIVQKNRGWLSEESIADVAVHLGMDPAELDSTASFYNILLREPVGRHVIRICDSISCWLLGFEELRDALLGKLNIQMGETTTDDRFTALPIVCLGACDHAPVLMIDEDLHRDVRPESLPGILERYA